MASIDHQCRITTEWIQNQCRIASGSSQKTPLVGSAQRGGPHRRLQAAGADPV